MLPPPHGSAGLRAQLEKLADASPAPRLAGSSWRADYTVSTSEARGGARAPRLWGTGRCQLGPAA